MQENDLKKRVNREKNRIKRQLKEAGAAKCQINILMPTIENVAWMRAKLEDAREEIGEGNLIVEYDNGGGQKGTRENPLCKGYKALWQAYMAGMAKIIAAIPEASESEGEEKQGTKSVLELVREKDRKKA